MLELDLQERWPHWDPIDRPRKFHFQLLIDSRRWLSGFHLVSPLDDGDWSLAGVLSTRLSQCCFFVVWGIRRCETVLKEE